MSDSPPIPVVTLFTRPGCHLCRPVRYIIERVAADLPVRFEEIDIDDPGHEHWRALYTNDIPVVHINGTEHARHRLDERAFREAVTDASATQ